ncbi:hypothetical protein GYMLUDRAFT_583141 [Collybiopsis luxurians FD-317 M1]|uniref:Rhodopsin domain-containing protein n=1 Tax=Collybiopsis luxurians FD-317 M1 TaxID=944289 RepID=A0A0D0BZT4_9AGAR|nr:hypothetical protein GYMLUDRAFT_583141 [Collybiopsis luxurians FD-317 M1]
MLSDFQVSVKANRILIIMILVIALTTTAARICIRSRNRRLWWDDSCAILVTVIIAIMLAAFFLADYSKPPPTLHVRRIKIIQLWILIATYPSSVWCARMSLLLSTVRLIPPIFPLRKISEGTAIGFLLMWISMIVVKIYTCASDRSWYHQPNPACKMGGQLGVMIYQAVAFLLADVILAAIPLRLLHHISLESKKRRMLILMFSVNLATSAITVIRTILIVNQAWSLSSIMFEVEVATTLIAANLAVLTPYIYRLFNPEGDFDSEPFTYYRSVQLDGGIRLRRLADIAPELRSAHAPEPTEITSGTPTKGEDAEHVLDLNHQPSFPSLSPSDTTIKTNM